MTDKNNILNFATNVCFTYLGDAPPKYEEYWRLAEDIRWDKNDLLIFFTNETYAKHKIKLPAFFSYCFFQTNLSRGEEIYTLTHKMYGKFNGLLFAKWTREEELSLWGSNDVEELLKI